MSLEARLLVALSAWRSAPVWTVAFSGGLDSTVLLHLLAGLAQRTRGSMVFTFAPRTPLLALMHGAGRLFPRSDRSPALTPVAQPRLREGLSGRIGSTGWKEGRSQRVASGFYTSQAWEWTQ